MALTNQFIKSSTCSTPFQSVNVSKVVSFDKLTIVDTNNKFNTKIGIQFSMDTLNAAPKVITLLYTSGANDAANIVLRDASYAAMVAVLVQTTV